MHSAAEIAQLCGTQGDAFDRTRNALNGDDIPDGVMVLKEDEEALHHIPCDALRAQADGNRACGGNDNEGF